MLGFNRGNIPFMYLGCLIFVGKPKVAHFQAWQIESRLIWELRKDHLSLLWDVFSWFVLLFMACSFFIFIFISGIKIFKNLDGCIRNFVWSGDVLTRKIYTVSWKKVCTPYEARGLEFRSLDNTNESLMLHISWKFLYSNNLWVIMCRSRVS